jgi:hypothetical protein
VIVEDAALTRDVVLADDVVAVQAHMLHDDSADAVCAPEEGGTLVAPVREPSKTEFSQTEAPKARPPCIVSVREVSLLWAMKWPL